MHQPLQKLSSVLERMYFIFISILGACKCRICVPSAQTGQKRASDTLEQELQKAVRPSDVDAGN